MKYINVKKVIALISAGFILISLNGCKKKEESDYLNVSETSLNQQIESEIINEPIDTEPNQYVEIETKSEFPIVYIVIIIISFVLLIVGTTLGIVLIKKRKRNKV